LGFHEEDKANTAGSYQTGRNGFPGIGTATKASNVAFGSWSFQNASGEYIGGFLVSDADCARIAAMSGSMPTILMTRQN
jgi:hypothetical protein